MLFTNYIICLLQVLLLAGGIKSEKFTQRKGECNSTYYLEGNGSFTLTKDCQTYTYDIEAQKNLSIIEFSLTPTVEKVTNCDSNDHGNTSIEVIFSEKIIHSHENKSLIDVHRWNLSLEDVKHKKLYYSRSPRLHVNISLHTNWSCSFDDFVFNYRELPQSTLISLDEKFQNKRPEDILQSLQLCIYNISAALTELNSTSRFREFREEIARIGTDYARKWNLLSEERNISSSQVQFLRIPATIQKSANHKGGGMYAMLEINSSKDGMPIFQRHQLENVFHVYQAAGHMGNNNYQIGACSISNKTSKSGNTTLGFFVVISVICIGATASWFWHQRTRPRKLKQRLASQGGMNYMGEDVARRQTGDKGRSCYTLTSQEMIDTWPDSDSDIEMFNKYDMGRLNFGSTSNTNRGHSNNGFVDEERNII